MLVIAKLRIRFIVSPLSFCSPLNVVCSGGLDYGNLDFSQLPKTCLGDSVTRPTVPSQHFVWIYTLTRVNGRFQLRPVQPAVPV